MAQPKKIKTFLSCSVRRGDERRVDALERYINSKGFECFTVGRSVSGAGQPDDVIRSRIGEMDCLIGLATSRYRSKDLTRSGEPRIHATPFLIQETAAAHQIGLPFLMMKTAEVTLEGVTARNIYLTLSTRPKALFDTKAAVVESALADLWARADEHRRARSVAKMTDFATKGLAVLGVGSLVARFAGASDEEESIDLPECFSYHKKRDPECAACEVRSECREAKKIRKS